MCAPRRIRLAALLFVLGSSCGSRAAVAPGGAATPKEESSAPRELHTARAEIATWERSLRLPGELVAFEEATLAAKVPGKVQEISVDVGTRVKKDDLVTTLEPTDYELEVERADALLEMARVRLGSAIDGGEQPFDPAATPLAAQAQAELDEARREHERLRKLLSSGISAQAEMEHAETRLHRAESGLQDVLQLAQVQYALVAQRRVELEIAQSALDHTRIRAPFDGAVVERLVGTGEVLAAGAGVVRLVRDDPVRLRMHVSEPDAPAVRIGQAVRATFEGPSRGIPAADPRSAVQAATGTITRVAPAIDAKSRTLLVEVDLPNPQGVYRAGSFASAEIIVDPDSRSLCVPAEALASFAGVDKLFLVEDGKAVEKRVSVGRRDEHRIEIVSGIDEGAEVVLSPGRLRAGESVSVIQ
jgi:RND family efflux transporter MFP subunit